MRAHNQQFVRRLMTARLFPCAALFVVPPASADETQIMKMRGLTLAFILTTLLLGIPTWANAQKSNPLFGTWRVTSFKLQVVGEPGERDILGPNPKGYEIITPEPRIMSFLAADGRQPPTNQAEAAAMLQSMLAYTGRITSLEPDKFTVDVEVSWNQVYVGKPQVRYYTVNGDRLTIRDSRAGIWRNAGQTNCEHIDIRTPEVTTEDRFGSTASF